MLRAYEVLKYGTWTEHN